MKKKNLFTICAASGLCLIFALALVWGMSIYAEKSGTQEFEPQPAKNESSDMITELMADDSQSRTDPAERSQPYLSAGLAGRFKDQLHEPGMQHDTQQQYRILDGEIGKRVWADRCRV